MIKPNAVAEPVKGLKAAETGTPLLPNPTPPLRAGPISTEAAAANLTSRDVFELRQTANTALDKELDRVAQEYTVIEGEPHRGVAPRPER